MASRKPTELYIPEEQTATILFTKNGETDPETGKSEDVVVMWMDVKADLTFNDRSSLFWDESELDDRLDDDGNVMLDKKGKPLKQPMQDEAIWERLAPFVLAWSVGERDKNGEAVPVPPPSEAGAQQFRLINPQYVAKLLADLRFRSTGDVSSDFLAK